MTDLAEKDYDRLLQTIYQAALSPGLWSDFVNHLSALMAGTMIVMHGHDVVANASLGSLSTPVDPALMASYDSYFAEKNVWVPGIARMPVGKAGHPEDDLTQDKLLRSEFYNDWLRPLGGYSTGSGVVVHRSAERFLILSGNIRDRDVDAIRTPLRQLLDRLAPHITRSFELMQALPRSAAEAEYRFANDLAVEPVFFLTAAGKLAHANAPAEALLRSGVVISTGSGGVVFLRDPDANAKLSAALGAIRLANYSGLQGTFSIRGEGAAMRALVAPFSREIAPPTVFGMVLHDMPVAILVLRSSTVSGAILDLRARFGLSPAEIRLTTALKNGTSLQEYALQHELSIHTVRSQLRSIYDKTGTHRQAQLVSLLGQAT